MANYLRKCKPSDWARERHSQARLTTTCVSPEKPSSRAAAGGFRDYLALVEELESLLGRRVEVIIARSLSPHFRPYVEGEARPL